MLYQDVEFVWFIESVYLEPNAPRFFSFLGATTDTPGENDTSYGVDKTNSYPCPMGHYCEQGDLRPRPCPNGTYNNALGARHSGECKPCARNHFNDEIGQKECKFCGEGTARSEGSDTCSCEGQNRIFKVCPMTLKRYLPRRTHFSWDANGVVDTRVVSRERRYGLWQERKRQFFS